MSNSNNNTYIAAHNVILAHAKVRTYSVGHIYKAIIIRLHLIFLKNLTVHWNLFHLISSYHSCHLQFLHNPTFHQKYIQAVQLFRKLKTSNQVQSSAKIGLILNADYSYPLDPNNINDVRAAERRIFFQLGWFLHPMTRGDYP